MSVLYFLMSDLWPLTLRPEEFLVPELQATEEEKSKLESGLINGDEPMEQDLSDVPTKCTSTTQTLEIRWALHRDIKTLLKLLLLLIMMDEWKKESFHSRMNISKLVARLDCIKTSAVFRMCHSWLWPAGVALPPAC